MTRRATYSPARIIAAPARGSLLPTCDTRDLQFVSIRDIMFPQDMPPFRQAVLWSLRGTDPNWEPHLAIVREDIRHASVTSDPRERFYLVKPVLVAHAWAHHHVGSWLECI